MQCETGGNSTVPPVADFVWSSSISTNPHKILHGLKEFQAGAKKKSEKCFDFVFEGVGAPKQL